MSKSYKSGNNLTIFAMIVALIGLSFLYGTLYNKEVQRCNDGYQASCVWLMNQRNR
jgi:hypothetical protein